MFNSNEFPLILAVIDSIDDTINRHFLDLIIGIFVLHK